MQRILITGSNRGIGLELARQYLERGDTQIFATCRNPDSAADLHRLAAQNPGRVQIIQLDVVDNASINASVQAIEADGIDILINNAGVFPREAKETTFGRLEVEAMLEVWHINAVGPIMIAQAYADLLRRGNNARLMMISSDAGSLAMKDGGCNYTYPASKAALNMLTRCIAAELKRDGIITSMIHPGWVQTDMGGPAASLTVEESARGVIQVIDNLTPADNRVFFRWDGDRMPW
jgi:NAD(P)-dependent dehydrogenase (short-subunit alcohol dehydrogenase family)